MNKALPQIAESADELWDRLQREKHPQRKDHLRLLHGIQTGQFHSRKQAASLLGLHRNTIGHWLKLYEQGGLEALLSNTYRGPEPGQRTLSDEVFLALKEKLHAPGGIGGYLHLQGWLLAEHDVEVNYSTLRMLVRRQFGAKLKVARPEHVKKTASRRKSSPTS